MRANRDAAAAQPHVGGVFDQHRGYPADRSDSGFREDRKITRGAGCANRRLSAGTLPPKLRPIVEAFADFSLKTAVRRIVKGLMAQGFGEVFLPRERVGRVVIVVVAVAVAF